MQNLEPIHFSQKLNSQPFQRRKFLIYDADKKYLIRKELSVADRIIARIFQTHDDISFIGYKENNETTTNPQLVKALRLNLEVTDEKGENTFSISTMISMRN